MGTNRKKNKELALTALLLISAITLCFINKIAMIIIFVVILVMEIWQK